MAETFTSVPAGPIAPGTVIRIDVTVIEERADGVVVSFSGDADDALLYRQLLPRASIDAGRMVQNA